MLIEMQAYKVSPYQIRVEAKQSSYNREHPVAFGQKREKVGVDQSYMVNNTLCRYCFQVHPFLAKKHRELPFLSVAQHITTCTTV